MPTAEQLTMTDEESRLLQQGLMEWCGPARCTEEFAVAMGFDSAEDLSRRGMSIRSALAEKESLDPMDWARALLATEIAFASDVVGSGYEWSTTTGWADDSTLRVLRSAQLKLIRTVAPLVGRELGTRRSSHAEVLRAGGAPPPSPAW
ncbi:hypothetical protein [Streptomyces sp. NBC_00059]|uniref:hypothetical protein n=1 Tax=Streptomyces sp. NBC_00059 TaxID=2975635 RepID=UPI002252B615|nr:hypothetical protein [Streptomyces sp. NBC_00059]MCX5410406.1 hypothetical protein [Streptomyces sp. NBC_00059]